eukprot:2473926-Amphidinium_carterae.1
MREKVNTRKEELILNANTNVTTVKPPVVTLRHRFVSMTLSSISTQSRSWPPTPPATPLRSCFAAALPRIPDSVPRCIRRSWVS